MSFRELRRGFRPRLSLSTQFIVAAAVVLCLLMAVLGTWVNHQITRSVLTTSGLDAAAFMQAFIEPEVQDARADGTLPARSHRALDALFVGAPIGKRIVSVKLWRPDGTVVYSSMSKDVIGRSFASTDVAEAAAGQLVSEFEDMVSSESAYEQSLAMSLIEVYAPLYRTGTNELLAVGEIYQNGEALATQLRVSRQRTWAVVCLTTLVMLTVPRSSDAAATPSRRRGPSSSTGSPRSRRWPPRTRRFGSSPNEPGSTRTKPTKN